MEIQTVTGPEPNLPLSGKVENLENRVGKLGLRSPAILHEPLIST